MRDQKDLIEANEWDWLIWLDGCRYDVFEEEYDEFLDGSLEQVWNGDIGYTGDWISEMFSGQYPDTGLFSCADCSEFGHVSYSSLDHFGEYERFGRSDAEERLEALGYLEGSSEVEFPVVDEMRVHRQKVSSGVIQLTDPHPPYSGIREVTGGSGKMHRTKEAIRNDVISVEDLKDAYRSEVREGLEKAAHLSSLLDGQVVITADHGECLFDCGQVFHRRTAQKHDHLVNVPWFEVE